MKKWGKHKSKVSLVGGLPLRISRKLNIYAVAGSKLRCGTGSSYTAASNLQMLPSGKSLFTKMPRDIPGSLVYHCYKKGKRNGATTRKSFPLFRDPEPDP